MQEVVISSTLIHQLTLLPLSMVSFRFFFSSSSSVSSNVWLRWFLLMDFSRPANGFSSYFTSSFPITTELFARNFFFHFRRTFLFPDTTELYLSFSWYAELHVLVSLNLYFLSLGASQTKSVRIRFNPSAWQRTRNVELDQSFNQSPFKFLELLYSVTGSLTHKVSRDQVWDMVVQLGIHFGTSLFCHWEPHAQS